MTEKRQKKADFKKHRARIHRVLFHYRDKFPLRDLVQGASPRNPQKQLYELASLVFLKAKTHDSKNHLTANIFKSGFSEGE